MSQPVLMATLELTIAVVVTTATVIATSAAKTSRRAMNLTAVGAVIALAVVALQGTDLRINFTESMPIGIYLLSPLPPEGVKRGMLIASCAPTRAQELGRERNYLAAGSCPGGAELLLKSVVATDGDEVRIGSHGVAVDGHLLPNSRALRHDEAGRRLVPWNTGHYLVAKGEIWLYAPNRCSWDSRYWGPVPTADVYAEAIPLLVARSTTSGGSAVAGDLSNI